jgi:hypothetical protein
MTNCERRAVRIQLVLFGSSDITSQNIIVRLPLKAGIGPRGEDVAI